MRARFARFVTGGAALCFWLLLTCISYSTCARRVEWKRDLKEEKIGRYYRRENKGDLREVAKLRQEGMKGVRYWQNTFYFSYKTTEIFFMIKVLLDCIYLITTLSRLNPESSEHDAHFC